MGEIKALQLMWIDPLTAQTPHSFGIKRKDRSAKEGE